MYDGESFTPVAKVTEQERYTIVHDYLGTPTQAYDSKGKPVWEMLLDVYGNAKEYVGEKCFIPFRYQGQYEDNETKLYYNRFRYYDTNQGNYISQDPIRLAGNNPTIYTYVADTNILSDIFGLYSDLLSTGMGHHLIPRSIAKKLGLEFFSHNKAIAWYPYEEIDTADLHKILHRKLIESGIPYHGSKFTGSLDDFFEKALIAYKDINVKGYLKIPGTDNILFSNLTPKEALELEKRLLSTNNKEYKHIKCN